ncbi:CD151 antigen isoform X2 [Sus scrofa]|uniref:CD151 antigen isoform X2 n=1 Tax=Sus scrofa TaxID=9823 RepID=UPI000A2B8121|nr:CD151 antigen isoform X2 [Sus scrofa]XP_020933635.1 CD151 antigen isoform X2 [Sus scrofa]XP_020933639.1 CD151 antigen isoform X2 [Sus scrofa]XP_020933647.1 CD151 antigen isoform X2 [Sus scrofa]
MGEFGEKGAPCGTICLKYLLFTFNCCFWLAGLAVMAVGIWTLALKSDYISLLASGTYLATAYILVVAGIVVMVTGVLGCCATFKERRNLLRLYFILLLLIFLLEIIAGVLAYVYYQQLSAELKANLKDTLSKRYRQPGHEGVTSATDKLQQEVGGWRRAASPLTSVGALAAAGVVGRGRGSARAMFPCSSTAVAATTPRTGGTVSGSSRVRQATVWFLTAAARRWWRAAGGGTTPPTSTKWRAAASPGWRPSSGST